MYIAFWQLHSLYISKSPELFGTVIISGSCKPVELRVVPCWIQNFVFCETHKKKKFIALFPFLNFVRVLKNLKIKNMKQNLIAKCLKICTVKCSTTRSGHSAEWPCHVMARFLVWSDLAPPPVPLYPAGTSCFKRLTFFKNCILKVNCLELNKKSKNMYKKIYI